MCRTHGFLFKSDFMCRAATPQAAFLCKACNARAWLLLPKPEELLVSKPDLADGLRWLTGGILIGLGLRRALPERR